ncbi:MAG: alpha/beta hydrolase [Lachnospiraceae bacterium]|nr:alpha/beta hydrolase [Lachnospiraceae bacterium]MDD7048730.1 alpha/beta hydrolase [Lachnospiraceae bacterium]
MRHELNRSVRYEVQSLITGIAYADVPAWYGVSRKNLKMDLICPKNRTADRKLPLIIWLCGGAYRVVDRSTWLPEFVYYARRGFVVASVEYRTANEVNYPAPLEDVKAAIRYLKAHAEVYGIDPERVAVMGESAGATLANLTGITNGDPAYEKGDFLGVSSEVNAIVDFYGGTDLREPFDPETSSADVPPWTFSDFFGYGAEEAMYSDASPILHVTEHTPPTLIFYGTEDPLGSDTMNSAYCKALEDAGIDTEYYVIRGAGHGDDAFYQKELKEIVANWLLEHI